MGVGILCVALTLRPAITSVGPVIGLMQRNLGLTNAAAGFVTTLPLLAFAALSPVIPGIARRLGSERTIALGLVVLLCGILLRTIDAVPPLFCGTLLIGLGIAVGNVLLPSLVKHRFPRHIGLMTSAYSTAMGSMAAVASGISVPLAAGLHLGWPRALAVWAVLVAIALVVWLPQLRNRAAAADNPVTGAGASLWRSRLAWQVTLFMGLQSLLFYSSIAWVPQILVHDGLHAATAGWMLSLMQFVALPATFATPVLADRFSDQRAIVIVLGLVSIAGMAGLLLGGGVAAFAVWTGLMGIGQGGSIGLALAMFGLRTTTATEAAGLSGMAQSVGYLLAACGPVCVGLLFDLTGTWTAPIVLLLAVALLMTITGAGASRNRTVGTVAD